MAAGSRRYLPAGRRLWGFPIGVGVGVLRRGIPLGLGVGGG